MNAKSSMGVLAICAATLGVIAVVVVTSTSSSKLSGDLTPAGKPSNSNYVLSLFQISCDQKSVKITFKRPHEVKCADLVNEKRPPQTLNIFNPPELCSYVGNPDYTSAVLSMNLFNKSFLMNSKKAALCREDKVGNQSYCSTLIDITKERCSSSSSSSSSSRSSSSSIYHDYLCCVSRQCTIQGAPCPGQACSSPGTTCGSSSRSSSYSSSSSSRSSLSSSTADYLCCVSGQCIMQSSPCPGQECSSHTCGSSSRSSSSSSRSSSSASSENLSADLSFQSAGFDPSSLTVNSDSYTTLAFTVRNNSTVTTAMNVTVTMPVPTNVLGRVIGGGGNAEVRCETNSDQLLCHFGNMTPGRQLSWSATYSVNTNVCPSTTVTPQLTIQSDTADSDNSNNVASPSFTATCP
jgi:hypothetical protein